MVPHGVDDDQHVSELGGDDPAPVVPGVLRPHDVDLVVAQVPQLRERGSGGRRRGEGVERDSKVSHRRLKE